MHRQFPTAVNGYASENQMEDGIQLAGKANFNDDVKMSSGNKHTGLPAMHCAERIGMHKITSLRVFYRFFFLFFIHFNYANENV